MQDDIKTVIANALVVKKDTLASNIKDIITSIKKSIIDNEDNIIKANTIDKNNNNGFIMDFGIVNNILTNIADITYYGDVILSQKEDAKKIIYGKEIMDIGNVVVISDGNPYAIIEIAIKNIMVGNTVVFSNTGYMYGTNQLLIQIIESVLEQFNISKYLVQIYITEDIEEVLNNYANIDLVIGIGDHNLQRLVQNKSKNKTIVSGYEYFDIYVEDITNIEFINNIKNSGINVQIYLKSGLDTDLDDAIIVDDIDEAIAQINYNGSRYSSAIFTTSKDNATRFIREIKSSIVTVNTSPSIERLLDIKQSDLINKKTIIYPIEHNFDGNNITVDINE